MVKFVCIQIAIQQFHEAAYLADDRQDLLNAINSFLDCSIVLPPSEMGGDELLRSVARFQREMLRKREEQEVKLLAKEPKSLEEKGERLHIGFTSHTSCCYVTSCHAISNLLSPATQRPSSHPRKSQTTLYSAPDDPSVG